MSIKAVSSRFIPHLVSYVLLVGGIELIDLTEFSHIKLMSKSSPWSKVRKTSCGRKTYRVLSIQKKKRQWFRILGKSNTSKETIT